MKIKIGLIVSGLVIVFLSTYMFLKQTDDYRKASQIYNDTVEQYESISENIDNNDSGFIEVIKLTELSEAEEVEEIEENNNWDKIVDIDISSLRNINKDVVGWIYFEDEDINYPVLHSGDNSTYLRRSYTGENIQGGSIFMDGNNSDDFSDAHSIIYGHNMKDLSMFGKLRYYATDADYILNHEYFQIITERRKYRYKIISYKIVPEDSNVYAIHESGSQDFLTFANDVLQKGNFLEDHYDVKSDDHLITLSTCFGDDRFVVSAVRCDESLCGQ